jgi:hypothetical protein
MFMKSINGNGANIINANAVFWQVNIFAPAKYRLLTFRAE